MTMTTWRIASGLAIAAALCATPALADIAPEPARASGMSLGLLALAVALEAALLRFGFRTAWWKAVAAAVIGSALSYLALGLIDFNPAAATAGASGFLTSTFIAFAVLMIVEAPVVFAFVRRQGWRWGFVALAVGNLISAAALTASL